MTLNGGSSTGHVTGSANYVGGLVGQSYSGDATIKNSYATGNVKGTYGVGGLIGYSDTYNYGNTKTILNSYAQGTVEGTTTGESYVGGLVGGTPWGYYNIYGSSYRGASVWSAGSGVGGLIGQSPSTFATRMSRCPVPLGCEALSTWVAWWVTAVRA
jgi:hypothetical protein